MQKLVLMSVLLATFAIPIRARRMPCVTAQFISVTRAFLGFVGLYVFLLLYVYPRLG